MPRTIEVVVEPDATVRIRTLGYSGQACCQASKYLEETLGQFSSDRLTNDYFRQIAVANVARQTAS